MNDERPIEKLLRRYAQKRGDEAGPPPEMHAATRRLLQGEVARQFPKPAAEQQDSAKDFFARLTRRWIYAVGVLVVLGVAAVLILPTLNEPKRVGRLAQSSPSEEKSRRESLPAPVVSPPAADAEAKDEPQRTSSDVGNLATVQNEAVRRDNYVTTPTAVRERPLAGVTEQKNDADALGRQGKSADTKLGVRLNQKKAEVATLNIPPPTRSSEKEAATRTLALSDTVAAGRAAESTVADSLAEHRQAAPAAPTATASPGAAFRAEADKNSLARGGGEPKDARRVFSQSFTNLSSGRLKEKALPAAVAPPTPVLANFQMEQVGNQLRVIDSDGSTYLGEVNAAAMNNAFSGAVGQQQTATNFKRIDQTAAPVPGSAASLAKQPAMAYQWRVEGMNRTLSQNVVFTWSFVETNALAVSQLQSGVTQAPAPFPARMKDTLIYGRARFGSGQEIEVNAVPKKWSSIETHGD